jgi:3-phosphoshikimate 1-carboxyvinyltransferase
VSEILEYIEIAPAGHPVDLDVTLPGSKSYTNRALLVAALATGETRIEQALLSDDTRYMAAALRDLGVDLAILPASTTICVRGSSGKVPASAAELFVGNAGTAARFLTAFVALGHGQYRIDGVARMHERPIGPLLVALQDLGVDAVSEHQNGCPPVLVNSRGLLGGPVSIDGNVSSQFVSALLLVAPCTTRGIDLTIRGDLVSKPYIDLTRSIMAAFGAQSTNDNYQTLRVPGRQAYLGRTYAVEPDASAASYFFAAAAVTGGRVKVKALGRDSAQGDLRLVEVLREMGCHTDWGDDYVEVRGPSQLTGIDVDLGGMSDIAQTVAAIAPFASGPVRIRGVGHIRHKETDRIAAVTTELRRLGATVLEHSDGWEILPSALHGGTVETYDDHRMAMSFAVPGLRVPGVRVGNPACVAKTFPEFFERFAELTRTAPT